MTRLALMSGVARERCSEMRRGASFPFVDSRMRACGAQTRVFTKNALTLLHQASGGALLHPRQSPTPPLIAGGHCARPAGRRQYVQPVTTVTGSPLLRRC